MAPPGVDRCAVLCRTFFRRPPPEGARPTFARPPGRLVPAACRPCRAARPAWPRRLAWPANRQSQVWETKWQRISGAAARSEEHTSELQSLMRISYAVFCLKKKIKNPHIHHFIKETATIII